MKELKITSPAFESEEWMPNCYSGYGEDFSPEIHMDGIDAGAVSMAITLDDLGTRFTRDIIIGSHGTYRQAMSCPRICPKGQYVNSRFILNRDLPMASTATEGQSHHSTGITDIASRFIFLM